VQPGPLPEPGGLDELVQDGGSPWLDEAACHLGSSREELALALVDKRQARAYENKHGVDPRSPGDLLSRILDEEAPPVGRLFDRLLDP
jgi:hypothetical protein